MTPLHCPCCRAALSAPQPGYVACSGCHARFPILCGLPLLVREPERYLARTFVRLSDQLRGARAELERYQSSAAAETAEASGFARLAEAQQAAIAQMEALQGELEGVVAPRAICEIQRPEPSTDYLGVLDFVRRDWGGAEESELEIAQIETAVEGCLEQMARRGAVLVLGAGAGRLAWDLRSRFEHVIAVDLSLPMAAAFQRLQAGPYPIQMARPGNVSSEAHQVEVVNLSLARGRAGAGAVQYLIADAAELPLADASVDCVVSCYFTDVMPLPSLIGEVARVLDQGGAFVHFGPLLYHTASVSDRLPPERVRARFEAAGFRFEDAGWHDTHHLRVRHELRSIAYRNWCFLAATIRRNSVRPTCSP
jgi:hypothetical protein